mmetsp:Transcript_14260/g.19839  ORF Transcript_14260/g.19839 Transcript_14260/m.19839 type:complete len:135 (+) Transcript_14260:146-550(+)
MACFGNAYNGGFPSYNFRGKEDEEQESLIYPCSASVHMDDPTEAKAEMASLKGGGVGFTYINTIPDALAFKCFLAKCYLTNLPDFQNEDIMGSTFLCLKQSFGLENWKSPTWCQFFCVQCGEYDSKITLLILYL